VAQADPASGTTEDEAALAERGARLVEAVAAALPGWVQRSLLRRAPEAPDEVISAVTAEVEADVLPQLRRLLSLDVDEQRQSPLAVVRTAAATLGGALAALGVPPAERDDQQRSLFPEDDHDLVPATFAELSDDAGRAAIEWGASKAFVHRQRHRG